MHGKIGAEGLMPSFVKKCDWRNESSLEIPTLQIHLFRQKYVLKFYRSFIKTAGTYINEGSSF